MGFCRFCRCGMARKRQDLSVAYEEANRQGEEDGTEEGSGGVRAEGGRTENRTGEVAGGSASAIEARARRRRGLEAMAAGGGPFSRSFRRGWTDGASELETGRTVHLARRRFLPTGREVALNRPESMASDVCPTKTMQRPTTEGEQMEVDRGDKKTLSPTFLYVPLPAFWLSGRDPVAVRCCNLLHSVHKLLHTLAQRESGCRLFTNCLQIVAPRQNGRLGNPVSR